MRRSTVLSIPFQLEFPGKSRESNLRPREPGEFAESIWAVDDGEVRWNLSIAQNEVAIWKTRFVNKLHRFKVREKGVHSNKMV